MCDLKLCSVQTGIRISKPTQCTMKNSKNIKMRTFWSSFVYSSWESLEIRVLCVSECFLQYFIFQSSCPLWNRLGKKSFSGWFYFCKKSQLLQMGDWKKNIDIYKFTKNSYLSTWSPLQIHSKSKNHTIFALFRIQILGLLCTEIPDGVPLITADKSSKNGSSDTIVTDESLSFWTG